MPEVDNMAAGFFLPSANSLFNKYEIGRLLGCGAFAKVYYAREISTGRSVAIKVISKHKIAHNSNLVSNVKREIDIMRRLRHPNIVKLYEVMATKTKIYFVMEFVKGGELFAKVAKNRLSESQSRKYFQQLISAIGYCHSRGVYHRDLKPENLLIDENGDLKVSDFGLSAVTGQIRADGLLHTLCGTPAYVAPEILTKRGYDGSKVDLWSCGCILFVLTAGYLPFNDSNLMMLYKKIYKGEYKSPKWTSPELKRFLSRLLDTNPVTRITVDEIIRDPWFRKGYKEIKPYDEDDDGSVSVVKPEQEDKTTPLNAFDIISFSSGLDLSPLFDGTGNGERMVVARSPEKVIQKLEEVVKEKGDIGIKKKKEWGIDLVAQNGKFVIGFEVFRLTESLVVVEVQGRGGCTAFYDEMWRKKIRPELLVEQREAPVA